MLTGDDGSDKRTNEIGVAIPLLDQLGDLAGKTVTADALLTQTAIASYLRKHDAHYMFVAKGNQKTLLEDIQLWFHDDANRSTSSSPSTAPEQCVHALYRWRWPNGFVCPSRLCRDDRQAHQRQAADRARTLGTARDLDHHRPLSSPRSRPTPRATRCA